jgi:hypothetical protein
VPSSSARRRSYCRPRVQALTDFVRPYVGELMKESTGRSVHVSAIDGADMVLLGNKRLGRSLFAIDDAIEVIGWMWRIFGNWESATSPPQLCSGGPRRFTWFRRDLPSFRSGTHSFIYGASVSRSLPGFCCAAHTSRAVFGRPRRTLARRIRLPCAFPNSNFPGGPIALLRAILMDSPDTEVPHAFQVADVDLCSGGGCRS